jgi:glycosyltransferase involved in cell wall biosynthesis
VNNYNKSKKLVILNGFETDITSNLPNEQNPQFTIAILGALYPQQDLNTMIDGFSLFLKSHSDAKVLFIGLNSFKAVASYIYDNLKNFNVQILNRLPRHEALSLAFNAHVLYYVGWKGYEGMYSAKIFEYIGLKRNILICPNDYDVIEELITETKAGVCTDSCNDMCKILEEWYNEWRLSGKLTYKGNDISSLKFSREAQANKLVQELNVLTKELL